VPQELLNNPQAHTLLEEQCAGGVAAIMDPSVPDAGSPKQPLPVVPSEVYFVWAKRYALTLARTCPRALERIAHPHGRGGRIPRAVRKGS
jgi:hypothetical protein